MNLTRSTITGAPEDAIDLVSPASVSNSTIANNQGAAINVVFGFYGYDGSVDLSNSTVVDNGGGVVGPQGGLVGSVRNSILAGNSGGDCVGSFALSAYNLIEDISGCASLSGTVNLVGVAPKLSALRANGGPTPTMIPLVGSPAINAGNPSGCTGINYVLLTTDQRQFTRPAPAGLPCDLGAVEVQLHDPGRY